MTGAETLFGISLGMGLAAACGFRIFVPFLVMGLAARSGQVQLAEHFAWMSSQPALIAFGVATLLEVLAYYIPFFDNLLDALATPTAVVAGTCVSAACIVDASPLVQWGAAAILGGGAAGTVQIASVKARAASSILTGGMGNPVVSTAENGGALALSAVAVLVPVLALALAGAVVVFLLLRSRRTAPVPVGP